MWYHIALFAHVLGALGFFIEIGLILVALFGMRRARTVEQFREWAGLAHGTDKFLPPLVAPLILVPGVYMVWTTWGWQTAWADVALGSLLLLVGPLGVGIISPRVAALHRAAEAAPDGPLPSAVRAQLLDPRVWTALSIGTAVLLGIVFLMTTKPALLGALVTIAIAVLLGLAGVLLLRRANPALKDLQPQPVPSAAGESVPAS